MINTLLNVLAPHYCCSCGEIGRLLCESCKYDIINEPTSACLLCGRPALSGECSSCQRILQRSWHIGERSGSLEDLIDSYKFNNAKSAGALIGDLLVDILPDLPQDTVVVPVPTIRTHIRQRGYDHTLLIARQIAKCQNLTLRQHLKRATVTVQRGANKKQRHEQAKQAFKVSAKLDSTVPYLLVDDVVTTGATLIYAAKTIRAAGARQIWAVAAVRQPLQKSGK